MNHFIDSFVNMQIQKDQKNIYKKDIIQGLSKEQINHILSKRHEKFFKRTKLIGSDAVHTADKIINNQLYFMNIWKEYPCDGKIDWNLNPYNDDSWVLYLHSLRMVSFLCNAYEETREYKYISKSKEIIQNWIENNPIKKTPIKMAWNDHSVSNRVINIIYFLEMLKNEKQIDYQFVNTLLLSLYEHAEFLADEKNYKSYNHGIMQDKALLEIALLCNEFADSKKWLDKSLQRLSTRLCHDINEEGVHLEHSPFYHFFVLELFTEIEEMLNYYGKSLGRENKIILDRMKNYFVYIIKPNGKFPIIGDSIDSFVTVDQTFDNPVIEYVATKGKKGIKPIEPSRIYPKAGIAILRDDWKDDPEFSNSTHLIFLANFHSLIHKHADDLSFFLYSMGNDVFTDSGKYSYNNSDKYRQYFLSSCSHNTITVDGKGYDLNQDNIGKVYFSNWILSKDFDWIKGEHTLFKEVKIIREILFIKPNAVVIFDSIFSNHVHSYQQIFNLAPNLIIYQHNKQGFTARGISQKFSIELRQLNVIDKVKIFSGSDQPVRGYISLRTNKLTKIQQVEFEKREKDTHFISVIQLNSADYKNKVDNITVTIFDSHKKINYNLDDQLKSLFIP